jgi:glycosyltransferase involved in cell wall biosynthesis
MGLGQTARGIAAALEAARLPFNIVNFEIDNYAGHSDTSWIHKETRSPDYDVTILVINPDNIGNAKLWLPNALFSDRYVIGYWVWELPEIPDSWLPAFSLVDEVWVPSRFVQDALATRSPVPVFRIPYVIHLSNDSALSRQRLNLPEKRFLFLSVCDAQSVLERKNPRAAIRAFQKAFDKNDSRVGLVLKIRERNPFRRDMSALRKEIEGWSNIHLLEQAMSRQEVNSLLLVTDCFVSLHRSEGFGLVPAEAMSLGKPVMMTRWSGNIDYMTSGNSIGIDYQLVKLQRDYGPYKAGQVWAEPDIDQATRWMKTLAGDRDLANTIGARGRQTIELSFSPQTVGALIRKRLSEIREQYS